MWTAPDNGNIQKYQIGGNQTPGSGEYPSSGRYEGIFF